MGTWSSTEPTLPAGSSWSEYTAATSFTANHYKHTLSIRVARLKGRQVVIGCKYVQANGSYGDWSAPGTATFTPRVGTTNETTTTLSGSKSTRYRYYTTEADAGATLRVTVVIANSSGSSIYRTITAPPLLSLSGVFVHTGGEWRESDEIDRYLSGWSQDDILSVYSGGWKGAQ